MSGGDRVSVLPLEVQGLGNLSEPFCSSRKWDSCEGSGRIVGGDASRALGVGLRVACPW